MGDMEAFREKHRSGRVGPYGPLGETPGNPYGPSKVAPLEAQSSGSLSNLAERRR